jgi:hypothetical protein
LTIATIFSFAANEELKVEDHSGLIEEESADLPTRSVNPIETSSINTLLNTMPNLARTTTQAMSFTLTIVILPIGYVKKKLIFCSW